jgi:hypothetical protein
MTPLTPEERQRMLSRPGVVTEDIDEYERLQAERFLHDPSLPNPRAAEASARESRLEYLYTKLYGKRPGEPPDV